MPHFRFAVAVLIFSLGIVPSGKAWGGDIRHTYGGDPTNSLYLDDHGGSVNNGGSDNSYYLNLHDIDQSAYGTLLLYAHDGTDSFVDDGLVDEDFIDGSGIFLRPLSVLDDSLEGEIGLGSGSQLLPVSFAGQSSGLIVEQVSYTSDLPGDDFVVLEYRVVNPGPENVQAQLALSNDFDVDLKSTDARVGFDDSVAPLVYQQEAPPTDPDYTTVGVGLIAGTLARYRLEACPGLYGDCPIFADDGDQIRTGFFQDDPGQVGDLTGGVPDQDFAVTLAADLGTIPPGGGASAVFCYGLGQGETDAAGLNECRNALQGCRDFYETQIQGCGNGLINFGEQCDDGNNNLNDDCPGGTGGTCQDAFCGDGFLWNQGSGGEACDDGNQLDGDGCSALCQIEPPDPSENTPPGPPVCGNGVVETGEMCDGNKGCNEYCRFELALQGGGTSENTSPVTQTGGCTLACRVPVGGFWVPWLGVLAWLILGRFFRNDSE